MSKIVIDITEDDANDFMRLALGGMNKTINWTFIDTDGKTIDVEFIKHEEECEENEDIY